MMTHWEQCVCVCVYSRGLRAKQWQWQVRLLLIYFYAEGLRHFFPVDGRETRPLQNLLTGRMFMGYSVTVL